jgi:DtxR family Mn-dependent transcriptional regulator
MLPSSTVENYIKSIYQGQAALPVDARLVPMGHVASALGVTPGTATTMVKALDESGLVEYEPYSGVRLTAEGERLALLVLRRHRLVELFLVQVLGMSWDEVHDDAEHLEHVVSERLIGRIDEMLGRPTHDPHGDPIPTAEGAMPARHHDSLLTCPTLTSLRISRITDQDPAFLRFVERNGLKPGQLVEVESRDAAADSVRLVGRNGVAITIGTRAASKLLVDGPAD